MELTPLCLLRQSRRLAACCRVGEASRLGEEDLAELRLMTTAMARDHEGR